MKLSEQLWDPTWNPVGNGTPLNALLETKRDGEAGTNICFCRTMSIGDEPEWVEHATGVTTVTHSTFAAPTHWRWPRNPPKTTMIIDGSSYQRGLEQGREEGFDAIKELRDVLQATVDLVEVHSTKRDEVWHKAGYDLLKWSKAALISHQLPKLATGLSIDPATLMRKEVEKLRIRVHQLEYELEQKSTTLWVGEDT